LPPLIVAMIHLHQLPEVGKMVLLL
jgi:hypothetical protein